MQPRDGGGRECRRRTEGSDPRSSRFPAVPEPAGVETRGGLPSRRALREGDAEVVRTIMTNDAHHLVGTEPDLPAAPALDRPTT